MAYIREVGGGDSSPTFLRRGINLRINLRAVIPALIVGSLTAIPSFASSIVLGIGGSALVSTTSIEFGTTLGGGTYAVPPSSGIFEVLSPVSGIFGANGVTATELGTVQSLNSTLEPIGTMLATPIDFMNFDTGGSNLHLYLTELLAGSTLGPFTLTATPAGAVADFDVSGYIWNTKDSSITGYSGLFSATFSGDTVAQLILDAEKGIATSYSGTFSVTTTPEPASLLLMGVGLLGAGVIARKKIRS